MTDSTGVEVCTVQTCRNANLCDSEKQSLLKGHLRNSNGRAPSLCWLEGLEVQIGIGICYDICSFEFSRCTHENPDLGVLLMTVYCGASEELDTLPLVPAGEAVDSAREYASGYAARLTGAAVYAAQTHGRGLSACLLLTNLLDLWNMIKVTRLVPHAPCKSLLIRSCHTSTTLCGRCVAEVWRGCGPTLGTLW